ncbi:REL [Lepeophtheirus salmonis]|uniref:REL n=1 Tax=Lepeophtheirus salmonis TaxID=72036 RepID=A0A7R8CZU9_LEPSM|nr:REL [Lepeophtheirus salmonis]CAF2953856.1 REL [Lepeophtheirus salmonis]
MPWPRHYFCRQCDASGDANEDSKLGSSTYTKQYNNTIRHPEEKLSRRAPESSSSYSVIGGGHREMESNSKNLSGIVRELELAADELGAELKSPSCFVIPPTEEGQDELVITLVDPEQSLKRKSEGDHIMANLTGFGNSTATVGGHLNNDSSIPSNNNNPNVTPYLQIIEQPAYNKLRFRYECEGRSAGALVGENTKDKKRTYPTIQIVGYHGPAVVVVSCVEDKAPYRAHPHNLVASKILQGFAHKNSAVNLNAVRLCFQAFLKKGESLTPLPAVVSNTVVDRKVHTDLHIYDQSDDWSSVEGGKKIIILSEKVCKDNIEVRFTQYAEDGTILWHSKAEFGPSAVHKQYAISFLTPPYFDKDIKQPIKVSMYLYKPCENVASEHVEFQYVPIGYYSFSKPMFGLKDNKQATEAKKRSKPQGQQDDLSSGSVLGPRKIPTAQLRHGGGAVTVVEQNNEDNKRRIEERLKEAVVAGGQGRFRGTGIGYDHQIDPATYIPKITFPQPNQPPESSHFISLDNMNISDLVDLGLSANIDSNLNINDVNSKATGHHESQHSKSQPSQLQLSGHIRKL